MSDHGCARDIEVLTFFFLAHKASDQVMVFDVPKFTVNNTVHRINWAILGILSRVVRLTADHKLEAAAAEFVHLVGSPVFIVAVSQIPN